MPELNSKALYLEHFGLREAPFKITPTTEFFYGGGQRGEILHALLYAIDVGEGIMSITGEVGSGKTMLLRTLIEKLPESTNIIYIANPSLSGREILYNICEELGLRASENRPDTVRMLQGYLVEQHQKRQRVIAFIDEAQAMPDESLEEIRLLSNLETSRDKLLQIVLFGQPEFEEKLKQQNMRQLRERITVALKLKPFDRSDVSEYIATRLRAAGYNGGPLFAGDACRLIAIVSQGLSRRINVLADKALLSAYERSSLTVNHGDARRAMRDVNFGKMRYRSEQSRRVSKQLTVGVAAAAFCLLAIAATVRLFSESTDAVKADAPVVEVVESDAPAVEATDSGAPAVAAVDETEGKQEENVAPSIEVDETVDVGAVDGENAVLDYAVAESALSSQDSRQETVAAAVQAAQGVQVPQQPLVQTIVVQQTVIVREVVSVVAAGGASGAGRVSDAGGASAVNTRDQRQAMLAAISDVDRSGGNFNSELLAAQIAENAELHEDSPQAEGGEVNWQEVAEISSDVVDNERWNWMPASSYLRSRLNATETWLREEGAGSGSYTARLITVGQDRGVFLEKFLRYFTDFYPIRNVMVYPMRLRSGEKFVVTFGVYASRSDAEVFIRNVPYYFTGGKPFAQPVAESVRESRYTWGKAAQ